MMDETLHRRPRLVPDTERSMLDISFLKIVVRETIQHDVIDVAKYHGEVGGGFFGIPRQVFCVVDFLGGVAYNNIKGEPKLTSTRKAVRFINDFFPMHYRPYSNLMVAMWRHGTVHSFCPFTYYTMSGNKKTTVTWSSNNSSEDWNRAVNIRLLDTETDGTVRMAVNIIQLATDLLIAFDKLIERMETKAAFGRACIRRINCLLAPVNCMMPRIVKRKRGKGTRNRNTGHKTLEAIRDQILKAARSTDGIERNGQVTWYSRIPDSMPTE